MRRLPPMGAIQAFVHVARLGSLKAAADSLALSSPALTRRIQALEQFVGTPLFERHHHALTLNEHGQSFMAEVAPHVDALADAVERVSAPAKAMHIRIAVPSLFASQRLMPELPSLRERHPHLQVEIDTGANRLNRLQEGLDAAIAITESVDPRLYSRLVGSGRIVALGARSLQTGAKAVRRPEDIAKVPILLHREMPRNYDAWRRSVGYPELEPAEYSYFDSGQLILDAAAEGLGVAFMFESHLESARDQRLVPIFEGTADSPYRYWFACQPSALDRRPVKAFHDWLFERFTEN
ncbi:MAG: LysR substrate-binding domain-containing protein [Sphingomicrobium sp.]